MKLKSLIPFVKEKKKKKTESPAEPASKHTPKPDSGTTSSSTPIASGGVPSDSSIPPTPSASSKPWRTRTIKHNNPTHPPKHKGQELSNQNSVLASANGHVSPSSSKAHLPIREWITVGHPLPPPLPCLVYPTHNASAPTKDDDPDLRASTFTVMSYNVLSPNREHEFAYCGVLKTGARERMALAEIRLLSPDIVCLQEVTGARYVETWMPSLRASGYESIYKQKSSEAKLHPPANTRVEGCAIFYKKDHFTLLDERRINYDSPEPDDTDPHLHSSKDTHTRLATKDDIGIIAVLRHFESFERVIVANTQLTHDPKLQDVKIIQGCLLAEAVENIAKEYQNYASTSRDNKLATPIIICGDFNTIPSSSLYQVYSGDTTLDTLLKKRTSYLHDRSYGRFTDHDFKWNSTRRLDLQSAYTSSNTGDQRIPFTLFTPQSRQVSDYIWYSKPTLAVDSVLGPVAHEYLTVAGFPSEHFPSSHISIMVRFKLRWKPLH